MISIHVALSLRRCLGERVDLFANIPLPISHEHTVLVVHLASTVHLIVGKLADVLGPVGKLFGGVAVDGPLHKVAFHVATNTEFQVTFAVGHVITPLAGIYIAIIPHTIAVSPATLEGAYVLLAIDEVQHTLTFCKLPSLDLDSFRGKVTPACLASIRGANQLRSTEVIVQLKICDTFTILRLIPFQLLFELLQRLHFLQVLLLILLQQRLLILLRLRLLFLLRLRLRQLHWLHRLHYGQIIHHDFLLVIGGHRSTRRESWSCVHRSF